MVKAIIDIDEKANRVINIVKAKENLNDKSEAINLIIEFYEQEVMEPGLRPEFVKELLAAQKEKTVKVNDFESRYG
ncbi:MAG: DUF2683 family protein [archaeon]